MQKYLGIGAIAGFLNGLFGGGGGAVVVPLLIRFCGKSPQESLASSVAIILPLCIFSCILYGLEGNLDMIVAFPYVLGGGIGGILGGKLFSKTNPKILSKAFGVLMILSGVRCLL